MLPSRFHASPVREISSSRLTLRSTIHFCSVVSSLNEKMFPVGWRTFHSREALGGCASGDFAGSVSSLTRCGGGGRVAGGADFLRTRKTWLHEVHFTVTPLSGTRASSNSYSVLQRGQLTSIPG